MDTHKLPFRRGVQAYIINDSHELLVVTSIFNKTFWKVPSGGIDHGEDPEDTVKREMMEELGIEIEIIKKCPFKNKFRWPKKTVQESKHTYKGQEQDIFIVKIKPGQKIKKDDKEINNYKWVPIKNIETVFKLKNQIEMARKVIEEYEKLQI